jgi:hypothetical protein
MATTGRDAPAQSATADREIVISRVIDLLGLQLIRVLHERIAFMRVADGCEGHTQIIGLISSEWPSNREREKYGRAVARTYRHSTTSQLRYRCVAIKAS